MQIIKDMHLNDMTVNFVKYILNNIHFNKRDVCIEICDFDLWNPYAKNTTTILPLYINDEEFTICATEISKYTILYRFCKVTELGGFQELSNGIYTYEEEI